MRKIGNRWALGFVGLGFLNLVGNMALSTGFTVSGERLTRTLRYMAFEAMVRLTPLKSSLFGSFWLVTGCSCHVRSWDTVDLVPKPIACKKPV